MKTYLLDIIPKLQRFSTKLDDLTRLTEQHWVVLDESSSSKLVYIFRQNGSLFISTDGVIEKANWEYLGHNSLMIEMKDRSYLFKHGFLDDNILALRVDNKDEYVILVNEVKFESDLKSIEQVANFLQSIYLNSNTTDSRYIEFKISPPVPETQKSFSIETDKGKIEIRSNQGPGYLGYTYGDSVYLNGEPAPDGRYVHGWPSWLARIIVEDGKIKDY